ncbi:MAG: 6-phosphogluconolactonase [Acidimicrobiales bacterium]
MNAVFALRPTRPVIDVASSFAALVEDTYVGRVGPRFAMLLSGGPTAAACYDRLALASNVDWGDLDIYMGDERLVPPSDPDANQLLVRQHLVEPVGGVGSFNPMGTQGDPDCCAQAYEGVLSSLLSLGGGIDLVHLGMGSDGHTASLFPGSPSLEVLDRLVLASVDPNEQNPHHRLSVTYPLIAAARHVVFTVSGRAKSAAVARVLAGEDLPASRVSAEKVTWIVDEEALVGPGR